MNPATEQLLDAALALSDEERLEFVEALAASLQPTDRPPFDESWREVICRRSAELRSGQVSGIPLSEVNKRARPYDLAKLRLAEPPGLEWRFKVLIAALLGALCGFVVAYSRWANRGSGGSWADLEIGFEYCVIGVASGIFAGPMILIISSYLLAKLFQQR
jgi:putative addiction module component (TIGR02574 family)